MSACTDDEPQINMEFTGSGNIITENRDLAAFDAIIATPSIDLIVTHGTEQAVEVASDDNLIDRVITTVESGLLTIGLEEGDYSNLSLRVNLILPHLTSVESLGAGQIEITGFNDLSSLAIKSAGSASFMLEGTGDTLSIEQIGSGQVAAFDFAAKVVNVNLTGSGVLEVFAFEEISGSLVGAGQISYKGQPSINVSVTGVGSVIDMN